MRIIIVYSYRMWQVLTRVHYHLGVHCIVAVCELIPVL